MTILRRHGLCWTTVVYWLLAAATAVFGHDDSVSCSREGRRFVPRPQVPCDLVKNSFCDTSGDSYPWSQLRKFVFENQGLIKRMYGYQTHYTILKDELLDLLDSTDEYLHDPLEMYQPENQIPDPHQNHKPSKTRNSVRSNAFGGRTLDTAYENDENLQREGGRGAGVAQGEMLDRATYLEDYGEEEHGFVAVQDPERRRNERHLDARSPSSRAMKLSKSPPPNSGKRSIATLSFSKDQLNGGRLQGSKRPFNTKERLADEKRADSDRLASIRITQSYSTKTTSEGRVPTQSSSSTTEPLVNEEDAITEVPASQELPPTTTSSSAEATIATPRTSQETTLRYSQEVAAPTGPQADLPDEPSSGYEPTTTTADELLDADEWVTAGPSAYVYTSNESSDEETTMSDSSTATRPPESASPSSQEPPLLYTTLPTLDGEEPTTTPTYGDSSEPDATTINTDEAATVYLQVEEFTDKNKDDKQSLRDHLTSESLIMEQRTSEGIKLNNYNSYDEAKRVKTTPSPDFMSNEEHVFRFPDEIEVSLPVLAGFSNDEPEFPEEQEQKPSSSNSRRQSNTRRPASAESRRPSHNRRRPSETWTTPESQKHPRPDSNANGRNPSQQFTGPPRSPPGRGTATLPPSNSRFTEDIVPGIEKQPGGQGRPQQQHHRRPQQQKPPHHHHHHQQQKQQAMWRRPDSDSNEPATTTTSTTTTTPHRPPPPTPSTVPTPTPTVRIRKGVNACPVETDVVAPYWANNTRGEVLALLNLAPFEQYVHWEKCRFEYRQMYCRAGCRCEQQYRLHRMLAFDPSNDCRGIFSDWFRFPSGCVCKCYDLPEEMARSGAIYNRSPRFTEDDQDDFEAANEEAETTADNFRELKSIGVQGRANPADVGDLSDVYFESEDDLFLIDEPEPAEERMDQGFSYEEFVSSEDDEFESLPTVNNIPRESVKDEHENFEELKGQIVDDVVAVLEGEPVHSLYSRAENVQNKPKVPTASITPQRRPRPHVISQRRTSGLSRPVPQVPFKMPNQAHGYNLRFGQSTRVLQYNPPNVASSLNRYQYQQQQRARNRYFANNPRYRSLNTWNPQASFPATLSNPRFKKYMDTNQQGNQHQTQTFQDSLAGSNNLNLNHLMKPGPPVAPMLSSAFAAAATTPPPSDVPAVTFGSLDVHTPHYYFNLTSHLIRTKQLDDRRGGVNDYKSREPRSLKPSKESLLAEEHNKEEDER